jgi:hypothetical protein
MKIGEMYRLEQDDRQLLERAMAAHEDLTRDLLDGHDLGLISGQLDGWIATPVATMLRTGDSGEIRALQIDVQSHDDVLPLKIVVRGNGWKVKREVEERGRVEIPLPEPANGPEIIEVKLKGKQLVADSSVIGVRVTWQEGAP